MIKSKFLSVRYNYSFDDYLLMLEERDKEILIAFSLGVKCDYSIVSNETGWVLTIKLFI